MTLKRIVTIILLTSLQTSLYSGASGTCIHRQSASDKHSHINSANVSANQSLVVSENAHPQSASDRHDQLINNSENDNGNSKFLDQLLKLQTAQPCRTRKSLVLQLMLSKKISVKMFLWLSVCRQRSLLQTNSDKKLNFIARYDLLSMFCCYIVTGQLH